ncbi:hypothetical protein N9R87_01895 [Flavobacteriaceae bacterium]|nr:hypothetical protein [Flavobacteriaceae bacterium]
MKKGDLTEIKTWIKSKKIVKVDYSESPQRVINQIFIDYIKKESKQHIIHEFNTYSS